MPNVSMINRHSLSKISYSQEGKFNWLRKNDEISSNGSGNSHGKTITLNIRPKIATTLYHTLYLLM